MPNIKLKGQTGEVLTFEDIERVYFDSADQDGEVVYYTHGTAVTKSVEPYFASGNDMNVPIPDGELVTQLTIEKPDELNEDNIRNGKTVAGVKGKFIGDTEEVTVGTTESGDTYELDFSGGNVVVEPTAPGKVISKATILKPGTLAAENIRKNVEIGGVVGECDVIDYIETDIDPERSFTSVFDETYGYSYSITSSSVTSFELIVGETYMVEWDGEIFVCVALDGSSLVAGAVFVGNAAPFGLEGNNEPFAIADVGANLMIACLTDTEPTTHTARVYQRVRSDAEKVIYALSMADGDQVIVPSEEGKVLTQVTVTKPETLVPENVRSGIDVGGVVGSFLGDTEEATITLDFTNGTQTVEPSAAGKVLSKVNIPMPDTLLPENIAEGIDIAGIIGTFAGGGGGETRIDYTLNESGQVTAVKLYGFTTIPERCFSQHSALTSIDFSECPDLTTIGNYAFYYCSALTSISIPDGVTSIGNQAFIGCSKLTQVSLPSSVTSVGTHAFGYCSALTYAYLNNVVTIGDSAFYNCSALTSIDIPATTTKIGKSTFKNCSKLKSVTFRDESTWYYTYDSSYTGGSSMSVWSGSINASNMTGSYTDAYWYKL